MKRIIFAAVVLFFLLIINGLSHSIYDLWHKQDLVTSAQKKLTEEKLKNQKLKADFSVVDSPEFIENEARNKLFLVKPGEQGVIIPQNLEIKEESSLVAEPNWQKWINLFK